MEDADDFVRLRLDGEAGALEAVLLTCRVGSHYYPGDEPLLLPIADRDEAWALIIPLLELAGMNREGSAVVAHGGACYTLTHTLWRSLMGRLCGHLEGVELGIAEPTSAAEAQEGPL